MRGSRRLVDEDDEEELEEEVLVKDKKKVMRGAKKGRWNKTEEEDDDDEQDEDEEDEVKGKRQRGGGKEIPLVMNAAVTGYMDGQYLKGQPGGRAEGGVLRVCFAASQDKRIPKDRTAQFEGKYVAPLKGRCEVMAQAHPAFFDKLRGFSLFRDCVNVRTRLEEIWFNGKNHDNLGFPPKDKGNDGDAVRFQVLVLPRKIKELFEQYEPENAEETIQTIMTEALTCDEILNLLPKKSTSQKSSMVFHATQWAVASWNNVQHLSQDACIISLESGSMKQGLKGDECPAADSGHEWWAAPGIAAAWKDKKKIGPASRAMERASTQTIVFSVPRGRMEKADTARALAALQIPFSVDNIDHLKRSLHGISSAGLLKSIIQKLIRFQPETCDLGNDIRISTEIVLVHSMCELWNSPGQFNPDIGRWIGGVESLAKRLAVILFEDSTYSQPADAVKLLSAAVLAQHVPVWKPREELFLEWARIALGALKSDQAYICDANVAGKNFVVSAGATSFEVASALLDEAGSFHGDENMARHIARDRGKNRVVRNTATSRPPTMPFPDHALDQHTCPSMVYLFPPKVIEDWCSGSGGTAVASAPFAPVTRQLFQRMSGLNPRRIAAAVDWGKFERGNSIIRITQGDTLRWLRLATTPSSERPVRDLDDGDVARENMVQLEPLCDDWIAGMVGSVKEGNYYVSLRPSNPTHLVAMPIPARGKQTPEDMMQNPAADEALAKVKARFQKQGLPLQTTFDSRFAGCSAILTHASADGEEQDDDMMIVIRSKNGDEKPWHEARQFETLKLGAHPSLLQEESGERKGLSDRDVAFQYRGGGVGIEDDAWAKLRSYLTGGAVSHLGLFRLARYLSSKSGAIELPGVSRDGGSLKSLVSRVDCEVLRALFRLCVLFPVAIRVADRPFCFDVSQRALLWKINDSVVCNVLHGRDRDELWRAQKQGWPPMVDTRRFQPMEHQRESLERLLYGFRNSVRGSFLHIPVGLGKTFILLSFLQTLALRNELPSFVLYVLPRSAFASVLSEIAAFKGLDVDILVPVQSKKMASIIADKGATIVTGKVTSLKRHRITLVEDDHVRLIGDAIISQLHECVTFVDEVHKKMAFTQRTSWTLHWAQSSRFFVALTGTPVIDSNATGLLDWLKLIVRFDCTPKNMWLASADMIAYRVSTGVVVDRNSVAASMECDFTAQEKRDYLAHCPVAMGGHNANAKREDLDRLTQLSYAVCTRKMLALVKAFVVQGEGDAESPIEGLVHIASVDLSTSERQCSVRMEVLPHLGIDGQNWNVCGRIQPPPSKEGEWKLTIDIEGGGGAPRSVAVNSEGVFELSVLAGSDLMKAFRAGKVRLNERAVKPVFPPEIVMLIGKDDAHCTEMTEDLARSLGEKAVHKGPMHLTDAEVAKHPERAHIKVVVVAQSQAEGYTLTRCGVQISSVYPSNQAKREQIEGRINRLGQARQTIRYVKVHAGILTYILEKHATAASLSAALAAMQQVIGDNQSLQVLRAKEEEEEEEEEEEAAAAATLKKTKK